MFNILTRSGLYFRIKEGRKKKTFQCQFIQFGLLLGSFLSLLLRLEAVVQFAMGPLCLSAAVIHWNRLIKIQSIVECGISRNWPLLDPLLLLLFLEKKKEHLSVDKIPGGGSSICWSTTSTLLQKHSRTLPCKAGKVTYPKKNTNETIPK